MSDTFMAVLGAVAFLVAIPTIAMVVSRLPRDCRCPDCRTEERIARERARREDSGEGAKKKEVRSEGGKIRMRREGVLR